MKARDEATLSPPTSAVDPFMALAPRLGILVTRRYCTETDVGKYEALRAKPSPISLEFLPVV